MLKTLKKIYITHCSAKKNETLRETDKKVTPDQLYTSKRIQRFINRCKEKGVEWAIFSDKYGVVFPSDKIEWYEKHPNKVKEEEFQFLLKNFIEKLKDYDEIWFYYHPARFHSLYKRLIEEGINAGLNIKLFKHISEIH